MKKILITLCLVLVTFGSASAQEIPDTVTSGTEIYLPISTTVRYNSVRFCTDTNMNYQCEFLEYFSFNPGIALILNENGEQEITEINRIGWADYSINCETVGCSAQGMRIGPNDCWKSEPTAIGNVAFSIMLERVSADSCNFESQ